MVKYVLLFSIFIALGARADFESSIKDHEDIGTQTLLYLVKNRDVVKSNISSEDKLAASQALSTSILSWEVSDGVNGIETGSFILLGWKHHPNIVASWFNRNPNSLSRWLKQQDYLFNGLLGEYDEVEALRLDIIKSLKGSNLENNISSASYLEVLEDLEVPQY
ncbi:hypothetical protein [Agaribacterium sp. ZY112]|uniref:hypothetical protein n=1 Tax=Agaribacterium sp. ZY112 TaxID=3233574 RepID=UPI0035268F9D